MTPWILGAIFATAVMWLGGWVAYRVWLYRMTMRGRALDLHAAELGTRRREGERDKALRARLTAMLRPISTGTRASLAAAVRAAVPRARSVEIETPAPGRIVVTLRERWRRPLRIADVAAASRALEPIVPVAAVIEVRRG